jgi:Tfp pilus assembly protein PilV
MPRVCRWRPADRQNRLPCRLGEAGFSLLEVIVAAGLLGIGLMPLAYVQSSGLRNGMDSYGLLAASSLAVDLCDKVRAIPYGDSRLNATTGFQQPEATLSNANPLAPNGSTWTACANASCGFTRTWKIQNGTPLANTKRIDVQVTWNEYGSSRSYVLSTIKACGS